MSLRAPINHTRIAVLPELGGRCAVATCALDVASVALRERPIVVWSSTICAGDALLDEHFGATANIWCAFETLNDADRAIVLDMAFVEGARYDQFIEMVCVCWAGFFC